MHTLAERVLKHIQGTDLLHAGDRVGVAVSGGIDSVALLHLLLEFKNELGIVLSIVHFNHKLRGVESDDDQEFVAGLARQRDLELHLDSDDVALHAANERLSVETAAREMRYGFFRHLLSERLDKIVTGHTLDDQAETVLMRLIRGSGMRGLGAIYPRLEMENEDGESCGQIVRPLLVFRRRELEDYLNQIGQNWREDQTNSDSKYTRNRLRHALLPLLEREFNPSVQESLSELSEIARGEQDYWDNEISGWMGTAVHWSEPDWVRAGREPQTLVQIAPPKSVAASEHDESSLRDRMESCSWAVMNASLDRLWFLSEPLAVQRRLLKAIGEEAGIPLEFKHVEAILNFASNGSPDKQLCLPCGWRLSSTQHELLFLTPDLRNLGPPADYQYKMPVPGRVTIVEIGSIFETLLIDSEEENGQLLDAASLPPNLSIRNWRAGDRFWPPHRKEPKKIKQLLQDLHVEHRQRKLWPVVASGDQIIWVRGFSIPAAFSARAGERSVLVREIPLNEPDSK